MSMTSLTRQYFQSRIYLQKQLGEVKAVIRKTLELKKYVSQSSLTYEQLTKDNKGHLREMYYSEEFPQGSSAMGVNKEDFVFVSSASCFVGDKLLDMLIMKNVFPLELIKEFARLTDNCFVVSAKSEDHLGWIKGQLEVKDFFEVNGVQSSLIFTF